MRDYEKLLEFAKTDTQRKYVEAVIKSGSCGKAAEALGVNRRTVEHSMKRVASYAASAGGITTVGAPGYTVKGESLLLDDEGNVKMRWLKTDANQAKQLELFQQAIQDAFEDYKGKSIKVKRPRHTESDLLVFIPIGDAHFGMRAWGEECGQDFDLDTAERDLSKAMIRLIDSAPQAETCLIGEMGDFLHYESNKYSTPESGNVLDADTRFIHMMRIAVKVLIHSVDTALAKFDKVILRNVIGNHAPHAEKMVSLALELYYHDNKRVTIDSTATKFYYYQHGSVAIGMHHGDKIKADSLPLIMAADVPEIWGSTKHRYFYIGHIHHKTVKEHPGCIVEAFNTLAGQDAWHRASGYRAKQNISLIVHHKEYGEIERITKDISMIRGE